MSLTRTDFAQALIASAVSDFAPGVQQQDDGVVFGNVRLFGPVLDTTQRSTTSATYVALGGTACTLTGLLSGLYLVMFGCEISPVDQTEVRVSLSFDGSTPIGNDALIYKTVYANLVAYGPASDNSARSTSSTSYVALGGASSPSLTGLPDGDYLVFFTSEIQDTSGAAAGRTSISFDSAAPSNNDRVEFDNSGGAAGTSATQSRVLYHSFGGGGTHTMEMQHRVVGATDTCTYNTRWLAAFRINAPPSGSAENKTFYRMLTHSLTGTGTHTIEMRHLASGGSQSALFDTRWLAAIRIADAPPS